MTQSGPPDRHRKLADTLARMESSSRDKLMADLDTRDHTADQAFAEHGKIVIADAGEDDVT